MHLLAIIASELVLLIKEVKVAKSTTNHIFWLSPSLSLSTMALAWQSWCVLLITYKLAGSNS